MARRESVQRAIDDWKTTAFRLGACWERERHNHPPDWNPSYWELIALVRQETKQEEAED